MELTLALITEDHGAVTEGAQGKVRAATDVAPSCIMVWLKDHIPAVAQHSSLCHSDILYVFRSTQRVHPALTLHKKADCQATGSLEPTCRGH